jgi:hypothetical protein
VNLFAAQIDKMKRCIYTLSLLLCCHVVFAQASHPQKTVYLYDGSKVKGTVTVNDSTGLIIVLDKSKELHYYDTSMVSKIVDEAPFRAEYDLKPKGYVCNVEAGGSDILPSRLNGASVPGFSLDVVNAYQFSPYVALGLGLGTQLCASGYNIQMVSVYADSRFYFMKSNVGPYLDVAFGYNAMFMKYTDYDTFSLHPPSVREMDNGFMFNPSVGVRVAVGRKVAMTVCMGYKMYYLLTPNNSYYLISGDATFQPDAKGYYMFNAVTIKAGFQF